MRKKKCEGAGVMKGKIDSKKDEGKGGGGNGGSGGGDALDGGGTECCRVYISRSSIGKHGWMDEWISVNRRKVTEPGILRKRNQESSTAEHSHFLPFFLLVCHSIMMLID